MLPPRTFSARLHYPTSAFLNLKLFVATNTRLKAIASAG